MKSTPDQAIYDFSNAIYKLAFNDFKTENLPLEKASFLFQCLIQMNDLKMLDGEITLSDQTIKYVVFEEKYTFWLVEAPEPNEKYAFLDYLAKEITAIFYNLNPDDCIR
ncbi:hypothetical protein [Acinetobacter sp. KS-LM10]|uniref:hypothetical protein n=1 Tax=Acinetobacter sp. KS-LM10 TaxID=3120518 RepID=UPI0030CBC1C9